MRGDLVAVGHQAAHQGGGDAEHRHVVVGDHAPEPVRRRKVRSALVKDHRRAEDQRPEDEPGTHHPPDVRVPEDRVGGADVEPVRHVLRRLHGKSAVHVQCALGLAGRTGRVDDHQRVFGIKLVRGRVLRLVLDHHLPHVVATVIPRNLPHDAAVHDDPSHGGTRDERLVGGLLHRHDLAAPVETVGADEELRLAVTKSAGDRLRPVAGEQRDDHRAHLRGREHRDRDLGAHRHEDADAVAGPDAQLAQSAGELADLVIELFVCELANVARLAFPDDRELVVGVVVAVAVEAALHDVHPPADPPGRPRLALRHVDDLVVVAVEGDVDVLDRGVPEPLDVVVRSLQQLGPGACGAEAGVKGPGAALSRIYDALLAAPPFPWLRPPMPRICGGPSRARPLSSRLLHSIRWAGCRTTSRTRLPGCSSRATVRPRRA